MLNTIRADFFRLFHTVGFYITQLVLVLMVVLDIRQKGLIFVMHFIINGQQMNFSDSLTNNSWNGVNTLQQLACGASTLIYFCLPLFVITIGYDLTRKTSKNLLSAGVSRLNFFLSKYLVFMSMCAMQFVIYYGAGFVFSSMLRGVGTFDGDFLRNFIQTLGIQFICLQGIFIFAVLALNLLGSNIAAVLTIMIFPGIILGVSTILDKVDWLKYINFQGNMDTAVLTSSPEHYWLKAVVTAIAFIALGSAAAYSFFRQRDY